MSSRPAQARRRRHAPPGARRRNGFDAPGILNGVPESIHGLFVIDKTTGFSTCLEHRARTKPKSARNVLSFICLTQTVS